MSDTRSSGGRRELAGHLVGGYRTLCERLADRIWELGGEVIIGCPVKNIVTRDGRLVAIRAGGRNFTCDYGVLTVPLPIAARLLRERETTDLEDRARSLRIDEYVDHVEGMQGYLGVTCLLLMLKRRLSDNYTLYLGDSDLPFTAVIESTNIIDPELVGGRHLVYLPKYAAEDDEIFRWPDDVIRRQFLESLVKIYPDFDENDILAVPVFRAAHVEPLHPLGRSQDVPDIQTPIDGLWLGSTKHVYPRLNSGNSVVHLSHRLVDALRSPAAHNVALELPARELTSI